MKGGIWLAIILLGIIVFGVYSVYDVFFVENPSPFSYLFFVFFGLLNLFVIVISILDKLADSYTKSKFLKTVKDNFKKYSEMILETLGQVWY